MSSYLQHLAERAGAQPPPVRPALPSMFESNRGDFTASGPTPGLSNYTEPNRERTTSVPNADAESSGQMSLIQKRLRAVEAMASPVSRGPINSKGGISQAFSASEASSSLQREYRSSGREAEARFSAAHSVSLPLDASAPEQAPSAIKPLAVAVTSRTSAAASDPSLLSSARDGNEARRDRAMSFPPHAPAVPTVHVTIGRIEVRAIASSPSATRSPRSARPESRGPKLSLDDYLRKRNGGAA
jgi:hypothetical protein